MLWSLPRVFGHVCMGSALVVASLRLDMRLSAKKACVTASARVWYLEPKWLRCKIRTCMCLYQEPGMCHVLAPLRLDMRLSAKKACVTASARVWYLEPKWLRCKIRTCMCLYQEPGMCHVPMGPRQEGRERGGGGGGGGREREGRETLFLSPSSLLSNLSSPLSSLSSLLSLSPLPLLSPPL